MLPLSPAGPPFPYLQSGFNEENARFSPDGRWVAFESSEAGRKEVYVTSFPKPGAHVRISSGGGQSPRWSADGRELFFLTPGNTLMSAALRPETRGGVRGPRAGPPLRRALASLRLRPRAGTERLLRSPGGSLPLSRRGKDPGPTPPHPRHELDRGARAAMTQARCSGVCVGRPVCSYTATSSHMTIRARPLEAVRHRGFQHARPLREEPRAGARRGRTFSTCSTRNSCASSPEVAGKFAGTDFVRQKRAAESFLPSPSSRRARPASRRRMPIFRTSRRRHGSGQLAIGASLYDFWLDSLLGP